MVLTGQESELHSQEMMTDLSAGRCSGQLHPLGMRCNQMRRAADIAAAAAVMRRGLAAMLCLLPASPNWHSAERALPAGSSQLVRIVHCICTTGLPSGSMLRNLAAGPDQTRQQ